MVKTNSKIANSYFNNLMQAVIEDHFDGDPALLQAEFVAATIGADGKLYKYKCLQDAFITIVYNYVATYTEEARDILKEALQETDAEANKYNADQVYNLLNCLCYRAFDKICRAANINIASGFKF